MKKPPPNKPPLAKLTIGSLEPGCTDLHVRAQYNPKDYQIEKPVPWTDGKLRAEYQGPAPRTATIELLFDGFEDPKFAVQGELDKLERLSSPREPGSPRETLRRPHACVVAWGTAGVPALRCVIEDVTTKYTMFGADGRPLRATCTVKVREIDIQEWRREERGASAAPSPRPR